MTASAGAKAPANSEPQHRNGECVAAGRKPVCEACLEHLPPIEYEAISPSRTKPASEARPAKTAPREAVEAPRGFKTQRELDAALGLPTATPSRGRTKYKAASLPSGLDWRQHDPRLLKRRLATRDPETGESLSAVPLHPQHCGPCEDCREFKNALLARDDAEYQQRWAIGDFAPAYAGDPRGPAAGWASAARRLGRHLAAMGRERAYGCRRDDREVRRQ
jgi:hypothetical protein